MKTVPLNGAHVIITGGARGIGLATAKRLVGYGARISLWDRDHHALKEAVRDLNEHAPPPPHDTEGHVQPALPVTTIVADITDPQQIDDGLAASRAAYGPVDILINNAGHVAPGRLEEQPADVWDLSVDVNLSALIRLTRLVIEEMYERRRGHIVNISSAAGTMGVPGLAVYSAAKWGVWGFSEALRGEAQMHGVSVSSIHPGYVRTGMFEGAKLKGLGALLVPRLKSHDVVARAIVEAALRKGHRCPKRPRSVRMAVLFRGILPDAWFNGLMKLMGVWDSMSSFRGLG